MLTTAYHRGKLISIVVGTICVVSSAVALADDVKPTNEEWLLRALDYRVTVEFKDKPFADVFGALVGMLPQEEQDHFSTAFDWKAMEDAGTDQDYINSHSVSLQAKNIRIRSALNFMLRPYDLAWTIRDELLVITTQEKADAEIIVRVYDVEDLVVRERDPDRKPDFDRLMDLITSQIAPTTWEEVGGPATIDAYATNGCRLVIGQSVDRHLEIAKLLDDLRTTSQASPTAKRIKRALESNTTIEFVETPLVDVIDFLNSQHGVEIQIDRKALKDSGAVTALPVTMNTHNIRLRNALWLVLQPLNLDYVVKDEVLLITSKEKAEQLNAKLYPAPDLSLGRQLRFPSSPRQPAEQKSAEPSAAPRQETPKGGGSGMF